MTIQGLIEKGNFPLAEIVCKEWIQSEPYNLAAWEELAHILEMCGANRLASRSRSENKIIQSNDLCKVSIEGAPAYLLSKAWGFGFFSDVFCVLGHLLLADITGRIPVVHWGRNSLFSDGMDANAFELFFEPVSTVTLNTLADLNLPVFPPKWSGEKKLLVEEHQKWEGLNSKMGGIYFFERAESLVVCDYNITPKDVQFWIPSHHLLFGLDTVILYRKLIAEYLRPKAEFVADADTFWKASEMNPKRTVAVHFRGSDKIQEVPNFVRDRIYQEFFHYINGYLNSGKFENVYLMTDDTRALAEFQQFFGLQLIAREAMRSSNDKGIHYLNRGSNAGREVLVDALCALRCGAFVGNGLSNPSRFIATAKDWEGNSQLLGLDLTFDYNQLLFGSSEELMGER